MLPFPLRLASRSTLVVLALLLARPEVAAAQEAPPADPAPTDAAPAEEVAAAEPDEAAVAEARQRYAQGAEFHRRQRYASAIAEFTEAHRLWPNPTILYALGQAYEGDGQVRQAIATYQRFLDEAPPEHARRAEVEASMQQLMRLLATISVDVNVPAEVYIDGEREGTAPGTFEVSTGRHVIELRAEGYVTDRRRVTMAAGTERQMTFELREEERRTEVIRVTEERQRFRFPRPVFWTALGLTGASAITWVALSGTTLRQANQYNDLMPSNPGDREEARRWARRADIMLGVTGGLVAVTFVVGLLTQWQDEDEDDEGGEDLGTGPIPEAAFAPMRSGGMLTLGWRR